MGGDQPKREPLYPTEKIQVNDLVHRTEGKKDERQYSDEYSRRMIEDRDKRARELRDALSRLGIVQELMPQGFVPRPPYAPIETPPVNHIMPNVGALFGIEDNQPIGF